MGADTTTGSGSGPDRAGGTGGGGDGEIAEAAQRSSLVGTKRTVTAPLRYMAVVFGAGLIGWAIGGPPGFAMGLGAGLIVLGFALWVGRRIDALTIEPLMPPVVRVALDQDDFGRLVRGQQVTRPGGAYITLRDIGWTVMLAEIERAHQEARDAS